MKLRQKHLNVKNMETKKLSDGSHRGVV